MSADQSPWWEPVLLTLLALAGIFVTMAMTTWVLAGGRVFWLAVLLGAANLAAVVVAVLATLRGGRRGRFPGAGWLALCLVVGASAGLLPFMGGLAAA